jgi:hypothetical protein
MRIFIDAISESKVESAVSSGINFFSFAPIFMRNVCKEFSNNFGSAAQNNVPHMMCNVAVVFCS